ncbi:MAG: hypothetical protein K0R17_514 [Rariglobus sp.]|jgi:hypothetical protein|nr:hypothetical protein [Rariglobus sp.]
MTVLLCRPAALLALALVPCLAATEPDSPPPAWTPSGVWADPAFFPLAVWVQSPSRAQAYRAAGINTYAGLWDGPTEEQLTTLKQAGLFAICDQNAVGLRHLADPAIIAWMHGDEPNNAQSLPDNKGYGPPIPPATIVASYARLRRADPSRPVLLNLGQGVAWDNWHGRGVRTRHPEDYPGYLKGCDIASFDIYPANATHPEVAGKLHLVADGVTRLARWTDEQKPVWTCIETTRFNNEGQKPTPVQVRAEVWQALIAGARGLIYFVHQFKPVFREAALLDDAEMTATVTALNQQITALAPVLNSPALRDAATVRVVNPSVPMAFTARRHDQAIHLFAAASRDGETAATFTVHGLTGEHRVEVLGENRTLTARDGVFTDRFTSWDVHLYRISTATVAATR